ncbi:MAG: nucleotide exchange factor GrpE [Candidatus Bathyarchaeota archaeon]|nr:MAG: nucleotide exchange factor GrpE [Candidatus Bathyarchaeota archaeon]
MCKEAENERATNQSEERGEISVRSEQNREESVTIKELTNALEEEKNRSEDYLTRLKYMQADFENLKKRLDRQLDEVRKYCNKRLVLELLIVVDELEAAVQESKLTESVAVLLRGVEMTLKKLKRVLELEQVSPIECVGQTFDPAKHEVAAKIESEEEGKIIEEVRKGYIMKGKVIRPSVVKVTAKSSSKTSKEVESSE